MNFRMFQKQSFPWWTILPHVIVLVLIASVFTAILAFVGSSRETDAFSQTNISADYKRGVEKLKADVASLDGDDATILLLAEQTLLSLRVPKDRLDTHLAGMIQLQTLKRSRPSSDATVREKLLHIIASL